PWAGRPPRWTRTCISAAAAPAAATAAEVPRPRLDGRGAGRSVAALARHAVDRVGQGLVILGQAEAVGDVAGLAFAGHLRGDPDVGAAGDDGGDAAAGVVEGGARSLDAQFALGAWRRARGSVGGVIARDARRDG